MEGDIRALIREVLAEELEALRQDSGAFADTAPKPQVREERVEIAGDGDLNRFVLRILDLARDGQSVAEIRGGRWRFRLAGGGSRPAASGGGQAGRGPAGETVTFEKGLVSERQVAALPDGASVHAGKRVRFTPLALDEMRRKRIRLERKKS